jgi:hypothetical protein
MSGAGSKRATLGVWTRAAVDSLHVLSAGATPSAAVVLWIIRNGAQTKLDPVAFSTLTATWGAVLVVPFVALVVLLATGFVRLGYRTVNCVPEAISEKRRSAVAKHVVFVTLYIASVVAIFVLIAR